MQCVLPPHPLANQIHFIFKMLRIARNFIYMDPLKYTIKLRNILYFDKSALTGLSMPNFSFLEGVILTLSVGWVCGELHNKA